MSRVLPVLVVALFEGCATVQPSAHQSETYYFDCDVPPGRFSEWSRSVRGSEVRVSGAVELIEPRQDPIWGAIANVFVTGKDQSFTAGLRLFVDRDAPDLVHIVLARPGEPMLGDELVSSRWRGESIPFTLSFNQSGDLSVTAGGNSQSVHFGAFEVETIRLSCSTGQFKYRGISIELTK